MHDPWKNLAAVPPSSLGEATHQLHRAVQLLAGAGQSFAEPAPDDSHRATTWDPARRAFVSAPFAGGYPFRVALRPADLTLQLLDRTDGALGSLPLAGRTVAEGVEWLQAGLANYMGALPDISLPDWEMPAHPIGSGAAFAKGMEAELGALSALYDASAGLLGALAEAHPGASPVRCWPHHFDIATLVTVEAGEDAEGSKSVGVGMAPMGGGLDVWYWYVSPWPYPEPATLPALDGPGEWHTEGWVGAVLTADRVVQADDEFRAAVVTKFVDVAVATATELLLG